MRRLKTWEKVALGGLGVGVVGGIIYLAMRQKALPASQVAKSMTEGGVAGGLQQGTPNS